MIQLIERYLVGHVKDQFNYLLTSIAIFLLLPPFTADVPFNTLIIYGSVSFVIISCIIILYYGPKKVTLGAWVLVVSLAFTWFTLSPRLVVFSIVPIVKSILLLTLFVATAFKVIRTILKLKKVNAQVIAGSVGAYLLFGLAGAMLFELVDQFFPNSFNYGHVYGGGYDMVYFSFVTLSTLGYGDITPHTPQGQAAAILVSIVGQLYLAILMAMLVGKFLKDSDW